MSNTDLFFIYSFSPFLKGNYFYSGDRMAFKELMKTSMDTNSLFSKKDIIEEKRFLEKNIPQYYHLKVGKIIRKKNNLALCQTEDIEFITELT